jgi:imidazolonepropionase-like amidohydrolase
MSAIVFRNCRLVDAAAPEAREGFDVLVEADRIREVSDTPIKVSDAAEIDVDGSVLMPGLIDCHVHVTLSELNIFTLDAEPLTHMTAQAAGIMKAMLDRGFTTVRDAAGADWGLMQAVETGLLPGPRLFVSGHALSQTGGHGDFRRRTQSFEPCACGNTLTNLTRIADGVPEVRRAARDELRKGANQIKVMVSGGVLSPNDPIDNKQYSAEELTAIVEEAAAWHTYVLAHAYTPEAIVHAVACGVRSIEHGNLIDAEAAAAMAKRNAYLVPTLAAYDATDRHGKELGLPDAAMEKLKTVLDRGLGAIEIAAEAGVKVGFGTDLLGATHHYQSHGLAIQADAQQAHGVIAAATATNAAILGREDELGVIAAGALADLLVVDGDPLQDLGLLDGQGAHLLAIMKGGRFHKNTLQP